MDKSGKFVPYGYATSTRSRVHTANMGLVRIGLMDQTVLTTTPSASGILCLIPLLLVHKFLC